MPQLDLPGDVYQTYPFLEAERDHGTVLWIPSRHVHCRSQCGSTIDPEIEADSLSQTQGGYNFDIPEIIVHSTLEPVKFTSLQVEQILLYLQRGKHSTATANAQYL